MSITIYEEPALQHPRLLVTWSSDAGRLGTNVVDCLKEQIDIRVFGEIEPLGFFPVNGVAIDDDVVQFPASKFFYCSSHDLIIFQSMQPHSKQYAFLNLVLDVAQKLKTSEMYIIGGLNSRSTHSEKRRIRTIANQLEFRQHLSRLGLETFMNYQGPPSINSYLLWVAKNRDVPGATFWGDIPFYLSPLTDWRASRTMLEVLDRSFDLNFDFWSVDRELQSQEVSMERLMQENLDISNYVGRLERGEELTRDEVEAFVRKVIDWM